MLSNLATLQQAQASERQPRTAAASSSRSNSGLKLHVPSPDWRDQVIYFLMTDRFEDGNASNNDQRAGVFDPGRSDRYSGGDLAGVLKRLDYIRGLGASAVWITPPVANQWKSRSDSYAGYHGYWAEHFMEVDRHLGTLQDYRRLSDGLHRRGMYLIQDIVVNHTGDFFWYGEGWRADQPARDYRHNLGSQPVKRPRQWPFSLNDPRRAADRQLGAYHWTPDVKNYTDRQQELNFQMSGLDDLNTENPVVRQALRRSYGHWIREVGVDGFRVDTAFYVPPDYFEDFLDAPAGRERHAGMRSVARATGRQDFFIFGEGFGIDKPGEDTQSRRIESYISRAGTEVAAKGQPTRRLDGMLNFPLYGALTDVYARGMPTAVLGDRIDRMVRNHPRLHWMPSFVDNHDVDRFLAGGSERGLRQALASIFTLPGIPTVYYGTEQGFRTQRASMFAAGWGSDGRDRFDTSAPLYRHIAELAQLRRRHPVFSRGLPTVLRSDEAGPGAIVWRMDPTVPGKDGAMHPALVAINTAEHPVLVDGLSLGDGAPVRLVPLWRDGAANPAAPAGVPSTPSEEPAARTVLDLVLAPGESRVWAIEPASAPDNGATAPVPDNGATAPVTDRGHAGTVARVTGPSDVPAPAHDALPVLREPTVRLQGEGEPGAALQLVLNGRLASAVPVWVDAQGRWQAELDLSDLIDAAATHHAVLWDAQRAQASARWRFRVEPAWRVVADVADPEGDDRGPAGLAVRYQYPTAGWGDRGLADLRRVMVEAAGGSLRLTLHLRNLSTDWNPAQGFDRVAFTVFAEISGAPGGSRLMPLQSSSLPQDLRWHRRLRLHGWSNALFDWQGATADHEGTPVTPGARVEADAAARTVRITLPRSALGAPASLSGTRLYLSTWDYDAGFRPLQPTAAPYAFGGGETNGPKIMDDTAVITLP